MEKKELIREGKVKKVYATDHPDQIIVCYEDKATAGDGDKVGSIANKGAINNKMTNILFRLLEQAGVHTDFIEELNDQEVLVRKAEMYPLEVIVRNIAAGHFCLRYGVEKGMKFDQPTFEFSLKNDELHDPLINDSHLVALKMAKQEDLDAIRESALKVNDVLKEYFAKLGIILVDFKLEYGLDSDGKVMLCDEISPDSCRFWDAKTGESLDKDRFRQDLGGVDEAYEEMFRRVTEK